MPYLLRPLRTPVCQQSSFLCGSQRAGNEAPRAPDSTWETGRFRRFCVGARRRERTEAPARSAIRLRRTDSAETNWSVGFDKIGGVHEHPERQDVYQPVRCDWECAVATRYLLQSQNRRMQARKKPCYGVGRHGLALARLQDEGGGSCINRGFGSCTA